MSDLDCKYTKLKLSLLSLCNAVGVLCHVVEDHHILMGLMENKVLELLLNVCSLVGGISSYPELRLQI